MAKAQGELGVKIVTGAITREVGEAVLRRVLGTRPPDDRKPGPKIRAAFLAAVEEIGADGSVLERIPLHMLATDNQPAERVEQAYDKAIAGASDGAAAMIRRKAALFAVADPERGIAAYRRLLEIDDSDLDAHLALARVLFSTGQWEEAAFQLRDLMALHGDYRVVRVALPLLDQAAFFAQLETLAFEALRGAAWTLPQLETALPGLAERVGRDGPGDWDFHAGIALAAWIITSGQHFDECRPKGMSDDDFLAVVVAAACVPPPPTRAPPSGVSIERARAWRERWQQQAPDALQDCLAILARSAVSLGDLVTDMKMDEEPTMEAIAARVNELLTNQAQESGRWVLSHVCGPDVESPDNEREVGVVLYRLGRGFWSRD